MPHNATHKKWIELSSVALALMVLASGKSLGNPKIAEHAVMPITQKSYPNLFAEWGASGVKEINSLLPEVAQKAAVSPECDTVDLVEVSESRSTPRQNIVFFVDCANGKRFYIDQSDLKSHRAAQSQSEKMANLSDGQATMTCEVAIKAQLHNPMTFNRRFGTTSVYRASTTGNVVVRFEFEAKNDLGASLPNMARCVFSDRGIEDAIISKQQL